MQKIKGMFYGALHIDLVALLTSPSLGAAIGDAIGRSMQLLNHRAAPAQADLVSAAVEGERSDVTDGLPPVLLPPGSWTSEVCVAYFGYSVMPTPYTDRAAPGADRLPRRRKRSLD